jgi:hypothetical protein
MQHSAEYERNRAWYRDNRKILARGKWYIIDNGALAMGPFHSEWDIQMFFEHVEYPFSEHAYHVRAGGADPDSVEDTRRRCDRLMRRLCKAGQISKLRLIEDMLLAMDRDMATARIRGGVVQDRRWNGAMPRIDGLCDSDQEPRELTTDHVLRCEQSFRALLAAVARKDASYWQISGCYDAIVEVRDCALEADANDLTGTVLEMYRSAACAMQPVWARTPADEIREFGRGV